MEKELDKRIAEWLNGPFDEETKSEIRRLQKENPDALYDAFFKSVSFGTGGIRAIMGVGTNRLNRYTIQFATQGLVNYIFKSKESKNPSVLVSHDSRNHSVEFAEYTAKVLAGNGIQTYLFKELRPVPLVSFGCRYLKCTAAVMITASHNPPEYNGYKVYWSDGAQVLPPHDKGIIEEVRKILSLDQVKIADLKNDLIKVIHTEVDEEYLKAITTLQLYPKENAKEGKSLHLIYTNLHGTGITLVPKSLPKWGFPNFSIVEKQKTIDGNFPYANPPNPEERSVLRIGEEEMLAKNADILLATDPDADRVGAVINQKGKGVVLTGNEMASICLHHILCALKESSRLPKNAATVKSIVTTELFKAISDDFQVHCANVLTGFKYIAEKIRQWEENQQYQFLFGAEESYGYLFGTFSRDKDAILACNLLAEVALHAKKMGQTLVDRLHQLYRKYGIHREKLISLKFSETKEGMEKMQAIMHRLRENSPRQIGNYQVAKLDDYQKQTTEDYLNKQVAKIDLPQSDVLCFWLRDHTKLVVRPSGTEPKIKIYAGVVEKNISSIEEDIEKCDERLDALMDAVKEEFVQ